LNGRRPGSRESRFPEMGAGRAQSNEKQQGLKDSRPDSRESRVLENGL
jgi:hypothetical protein